MEQIHVFYPSIRIKIGESTFTIVGMEKSKAKQKAETITALGGPESTLNKTYYIN